MSKPPTSIEFRVHRAIEVAARGDGAAWLSIYDPKEKDQALDIMLKRLSVLSEAGLPTHVQLQFTGCGA